jgi:hypothetical protein
MNIHEIKVDFIQISWVDFCPDLRQKMSGSGSSLHCYCQGAMGLNAKVCKGVIVKGV